MSSSSPPEQPGKREPTPHLDAEELEEAEDAYRQERRTAETALGVKAKAAPRRGLVTAALAVPGVLWLLFYLVAPVVFIVLTSFWVTTRQGQIETTWTLDSYRALFDSSAYWSVLKQTIFNSLIVVGATLVIGFPVAYFLVFKVKSLRNQIALFIVAVAPFWTSALIRAVAWRDPLMGRNGAVNSILQKIGIIDEPLSILSFSNFSVVLALIQLYVLFMIAPLFFMLAQVDRSALEAARDLGASWWQSFREVTLPQTMPGVVIGSIFVFVLTMGEFATVRLVGSTVAQVATLVRVQNDSVQFSNAAASAVVLVLVMTIGVIVLLRFANLREEL